MAGRTVGECPTDDKLLPCVSGSMCRIPRQMWSHLCELSTLCLVMGRHHLVVMPRRAGAVEQHFSCINMSVESCKCGG